MEENRERRTIANYISGLMTEYPIVVLIPSLIIGVVTLKFGFNLFNNTLLEVSNNISEMVDEEIEPIIEEKSYMVVKCDVDRAYLRFDKYVVVLQSDDDSLVFDTYTDYEKYLPYFGKEIKLRITRHGVREGNDGYAEYEIMN